MAKRSESEPKTRITLNLPAALVKQAKHYAVDHDKDLQDVVADALRAHLPEARRR